ncbi:MAG: hypothetical protein IKX91_02415 [Firmicutes bacterium]|nr:hypothetical protein [Bacillota bacterium]
MFGYVLANTTELSEEELARYRSCYCGLCHTIKERAGSLERTALTYDMTFLILVLSSLYEPEETEGEGRCIVHPFRKHSWMRNEFTDYAADLNIYLAYYNALDDAMDEGSWKGTFGIRLFRSHAERIEQLWPRQCEVIRNELALMNELEKQNGEPAVKADQLANSFGRLLGELFVWKEDRWEPILRAMAEALGRFVYMADAFTDLEKDVKTGNYNPLLTMHDRAEGVGEKDAAYFASFDLPSRSILTMHIAAAAEELEKLPLEKDLPILRNILYSGAWARVNAAADERAKKAGKETNEDGSV